VLIVGVNVPIVKCVSIYLAFIKVEKPDRFRRRQITIGRFQSAVFKVIDFEHLASESGKRWLAGLLTLHLSRLTT
jgi:hypothetical protein